MPDSRLLIEIRNFLKAKNAAFAKQHRLNAKLPVRNLRGAKITRNTNAKLSTKPMNAFKKKVNSLSYEKLVSLSLQKLTNEQHAYVRNRMLRRRLHT